MPTCFVIQPFDGGAFDKRYDDTFAPAIVAAQLEPYRVDRDAAAAIPIEDIETGIRRADVCLADISIPNPNVWFEVGYSIAAGKPIVLVCHDDPQRRFPFDIQHRAVITYRTDSLRDFEELRSKITDRLRAALKKEENLGRLARSAVVNEVEGLNSIEIASLVTVASNVDGPLDQISAWNIRQDMEKSGYTRIACTLGLASLVGKVMLSSERIDDHDGEYTVYQVTEKGFSWLFHNQDKLVLHQEPPRRRSNYSGMGVDDDDVPF